MKTMQFRTNLNCGSCVAAVTPFLDAEGSIERWSVDTKSPAKTLTVAGDGASEAVVRSLVEQAGFRAIEKIEGGPALPVLQAPAPQAEPVSEPRPEPDPEKSLKSYYPLALIVAFLVGVVGLVEVRLGSFDPMRAMGSFMAAFFLTFSFFKLLNLPAFAMAYSTYDVVARRWTGYGYVYPFIELGLGVAYLIGFNPTLTNLVTVAVMGVSTVGVVRSLMERKKIRCACLGTVFNLPMTYVTVAEDVLMVGMAIAMLLIPGAGH